MQNVIHLCEHPKRKHQEDQHASFRGQLESGWEVFGDQPHAYATETERLKAGTWEARELRVRSKKSSFTDNRLIHFGIEHGLIIGLICGIVLGHVDRAATADLLAEARHTAAQCAQSQYEELDDQPDERKTQ